jgi:G:T-mismatch repair DNA endonuclease (very short patch repair protein)
MQDVKPGEQLMGVTFKSKEVTECDLEEYKDLQARIDELRKKLEGEDEEDDDGDVIVRV